MTSPNRAPRKTTDIAITMPPWVAPTVATVLEEAAARWQKQAEDTNSALLIEGSLSTLKGMATLIRDQLSENGSQ